MNDPAPQTANSGAPPKVPWSALAAAMTATSSAPSSMPTAIRTITSVRIAGVRSDPPQDVRSAGAGCQLRDAGCAANAAVVASRTRPAAASAAPLDHSAPMQSASGGPKMYVSSTSDASSA